MVITRWRMFLWGQKSFTISQLLQSNVLQKCRFGESGTSFQPTLLRFGVTAGAFSSTEQLSAKTIALNRNVHFQGQFQP